MDKPLNRVGIINASRKNLMYQWLLELISVSSYRFDTTEIVFIINLISDIASLAETLTFGKGGYQTPNLTSGKGRVGISDVYLGLSQ